MAKEKEILRLHFEGFSQREICRALRCGGERVNRLLKAARQAQVDWEALASLDDGDISDLLLPSLDDRSRFAQPDFEKLAKELCRAGVTRKLLWYEYCNNISDSSLTPYQYAQFCRLFDRYLKGESATMRLTHTPGQRMFVDWAGDCAHIIDPVTGEVGDVWLFVASFPYSAALFARGYPDMKQQSFLAGHMDAFTYFGGVPAIIVPDNCKTATNKASIYLTQINETYYDFASYYQSAIVPARIKRPNDKAAVEGAVLMVERQILAPLRDERFFSLDELNEAIADKVDAINKAPFQKRAGSRWSVFKDEESEHLKDLSPHRFEIAEYKKVKTSLDYHVQIDTMRYSVPYRLIGEYLDARITSREIIISRRGSIVATHRRLHGRKGQCSTISDHMPPAHLRYEQDWSPARFTSWAERIGPATLAVTERVLASREIVEQSYVPALNILNLGRSGKRSLLEEACCELLERGMHTPTYSAIKHTMAALSTSRQATGTTPKPIEARREDRLSDVGYVRGADYYATRDSQEDCND